DGPPVDHPHAGRRAHDGHARRRGDLDVEPRRADRRLVLEAQVVGAPRVVPLPALGTAPGRVEGRGPAAVDREVALDVWDAEVRALGRAGRGAVELGGSEGNAAGG